MFTQKFLFNFVALIVATYLIGFSSDVYYRIFWFDDALHFAGGMAVAIGASLFFKKDLAVSRRKLVIVVFLVGSSAVIGIGWEFFEWILDRVFFTERVFRNQPSLNDTMSDLLFDISGGLLAALAYLKYVFTESLRKQEI